MASLLSGDTAQWRHFGAETPRSGVTSERRHRAVAGLRGGDTAQWRHSGTGDCCLAWNNYEYSIGAFLPTVAVLTQEPFLRTYQNSMNSGLKKTNLFKTPENYSDSVLKLLAYDGDRHCDPLTCRTAHYTVLTT